MHRAGGYVFSLLSVFLVVVLYEDPGESSESLRLLCSQSYNRQLLVHTRSYNIRH